MSSIDLSSFAGGAVVERFNIELQKILENVADPNTDPKKARKLQLTLTIKADENRDIANVSIQTKTTLVPAKEIETKLIMDRDSRGRIVGQELKSGVKGQMYITDDGQVADDRGKVIDLKQSSESQNTDDRSKVIDLKQSK
ncbi:replication terminator protein [Bacillaceae bacterium]